MKMAFVLLDGMTSMDFAGFYEARLGRNTPNVEE